MLRGITAVVIGLMCAHALAQDCTFDSADLLLRPGEAGQPTDVLIRAYVVDITKILDVEQSFVTDVYFRAEWSDPRLAHDGPLRLQSEELTRFMDSQESVSLNRRDVRQVRGRRSPGCAGRKRVLVVRRLAGVSYEADLGVFPFDPNSLSFCDCFSLTGRKTPVLRSGCGGSGAGRGDCLLSAGI